MADLCKFGTEYVPLPNGGHNGIITRFNNAVTFTSSTTRSGNPSDVLNWNQSAYSSVFAPDQWIQISFKEIKVYAENYRLKSSNEDNHLVGWKFEGSNDKIHWVTIDNRTSDFSIAGKGFESNFHVEKFGIFSDFRIVHQKNLIHQSSNQDEETILLLSGIEIYGLVFNLNLNPRPDWPTYHLDGKVISYLQSNRSPDLLRNNFLFTASSAYGYEYKPEFACETRYGYYQSMHSLNSWITLTFNHLKVSIFAYQWEIFGPRLAVDPGFPRAWKLEGSNDNIKWTLIDQRTNDLTFVSYFQQSTFEVQNRGIYSAFRLTQTGPDSKTRNWLVVNAFDVIGDYIFSPYLPS